MDTDTAVRSIEFVGVRTLSESDLRRVLETRTRGAAYGLRSALAKLPLIDQPARHPFSPVELQRDVVRLRQACAAEGFLSAKVRYEVERDESEDLLDITFVVDEGTPVLVTDVAVIGPDSLAPLPVPDSELESWSHLERSARKLRGRRLDISAAQQQQDRMQQWWRNHGFPLATVHARLAADSLGNDKRIEYRIFPGRAARFGQIEVDGNSSISDQAVLRKVELKSGSRYSAEVLSRARTDIQQLEIVRVARLEVSQLNESDSLSATPARADSVLPVRVVITEAEPRLVSGEVGYVSDAGVSAELRWTHRNFTGEGRTLNLSALAQSGLWSTIDDPEKRYRGSIAIHEPYVFHRRLSGALSPFVEHRDTEDRSLEYGMNATLIYRLKPMISGSLDYRIGRTRVYEYGLEGLAAGDIDLLTFLTRVAQGYLDSLGTTLHNSVFTVSGTVGSVDDPANPRKGIVLRPTVQVTAPTGMSSTSYWRLDGAAYGYVPLARRATLASRLALGRLYPFGKSLPAPGQSSEAEFLRLRDVTFTAGGAGDVRGWESRLLGPKFPEIRFREEGDSTVAEADGYVPVGGFARMAFYLELQLPFPGLGPNFGSHVFLDGGRVWTSDSRFSQGHDELGQEKTFYSPGAGMDLRTPVGPIKFSVGYKLNPAITDLVDSDDLLSALLENRPVDELAKKNSRRWQFNLAIGSSF